MLGMPDGSVNENALGNARSRSSGGYHPPTAEGHDPSAEPASEPGITYGDEHRVAQFAACVDPSPRVRRVGVAHVYEMHYRFG
jgi:hypothetical protein